MIRPISRATARRAASPLAGAAILLVLFAFGPLGTSPAAAYEYINSCNGNKSVYSGTSRTLVGATISFPTGSAQRNALDASVRAWNFDTPGTRFRWVLDFQNTTSFTRSDGKNDVAFTSNVEGLAWPAGALAVALPRFENCPWLFGDADLEEADVLFNNAILWDYSTQPAVDTVTQPLCARTDFFQRCNFMLVSIHELGHAFGLDHENDIMATMNAVYPNSGVLGNDNDVHPHADDVRGNRAGYGSSGTERDLAASAYERTQPGWSAPIVAPATAFRGHPTPMRFTITNRGTADQTSVRVGYYLSTDRLITTGDRLLGTGFFNLTSGASSTLTANVTVPTSVTPGNYWLGILMDGNNEVFEKDEGNNAVALLAATNVPTQSPPKPCFTLTPTSGTVPLTVTVNASCSTDPVGSITSYSWTFGDGGTRTGQTATYTYWNPGNFQITLTTRDDTNLSRSTSKWVYAYSNTGCGTQIICEEPLAIE